VDYLDALLQGAASRQGYGASHCINLNVLQGKGTASPFPRAGWLINIIRYQVGLNESAQISQLYYALASIL